MAEREPRGQVAFVIKTASSESIHPSSTNARQQSSRIWSLVHCATVKGFAFKSALKSAAISEAIFLKSSSVAFFLISNRAAGEYEVRVITGPCRLSLLGGLASS